MSALLEERNKRIYILKHVEKQSYKDIAQTFDISETRVRQILEQERERRKRIAYLIEKAIPEIDYICEKKHASKTTRGRIYNALAESGLLLNRKWIFATRKQLSNIRNLGPRSIEIILEAAEIALDSSYLDP